MSVKKYQGVTGLRWQWRVSYRDGDGVRRTQSGTERTKRLADAAEAQAWEQVRGGTVVDPKLTVAAFLTRYLAARRVDGLRRSTLLVYEARLRTHVLPHLGGVRLTKLTPLLIEDWKAALLAGGERRRALSANTIRTTMTIFNTALNYAVKWRLLAANPMAGAALPRAVPTPERRWTVAQARTFLRATADDDCSLIWHLALFLGLRIGELCGLRWPNLDLAGGWLVVADIRTEGSGAIFEEASPKSAAGRRRLPVPQPLIPLLLAHRTAQATRRAAAPVWAAGDSVFDQAGEPWHPARVRSRFTAAVQRTGLPRIRPHDCRHTTATLLIELGVDPKVVSQILGHTSVAMTYRYVHPGEGEKRSAIEQLWGAIAGDADATRTEMVQKREKIVPIRPVSRGKARGG